MDETESICQIPHSKAEVYGYLFGFLFHRGGSIYYWLRQNTSFQVSIPFPLVNNVVLTQITLGIVGEGRNVLLY